MPLPESVEVRPMTSGDVKSALAMIAAYDPEDAESAEASYRRGLDGQFALTAGGQVVGVTGFRAIEHTDRAYWLSWSYIDLDHSRSRLTGQHVLECAVDRLRAENGRKLFVEVSASDAPIDSARQYGAAKGMYERFGFKGESHHADYYQHGEDMSVLSYRIEDPKPAADIEPETRPLVVTDADEIFETDDAYFVEWAYADDGSESSVRDITKWVDKIGKWDGRCAFIGVPSHATTAQQQVQEAGFAEDGRLKDLICDGIDEVRYRVDL